MKFFFKKLQVALILATFLIYPIAFATPLFAQNYTQYEASELVPRSEIYLSPKSGSFEEGANFEIKILLDTLGNNINAVDLNLSFNPKKLSIVNPSSGNSIFGIWVEAPTYDNTKGTARLSGVIPEGINTNSGLIATITFKANETGNASIKIEDSSQVLINDGFGTKTISTFGRSDLTILAKAPGGINVYSDTHSSQNKWYNNNSPSLFWDEDPQIDGFSFVLDNKPGTIPGNEPFTEETFTSFENLNDGLWYFHIKAQKKGVWGATTHFLIKIDTTPPAEFTPTIDYLKSENNQYKNLVSFFTTDALSGAERYEIGFIDKEASTTTFPVLVEASSPFQIPQQTSGDLRIIVRAYDQAGNTTDAYADVDPDFGFESFKKTSLPQLLLIILGILIIGLLFHYLVGHHILAYVRRAAKIAKEEQAKDNHDFKL